jgi:hypothetical protein
MSENLPTESAEQPTSALGLDIGTSRIVLASGTQGTETQSQHNAFVSVPYAKMTENILEQNRMVYYRNGKELYIYGNDSERFASFFNAVPRRPMQRGVLNAQERMGEQVIQAIVEGMVPRTRKNDTLCFSVPGKVERRGESGISRSGAQDVSSISRLPGKGCERGARSSVF